MTEPQLADLDEARREDELKQTIRRLQRQLARAKDRKTDLVDATYQAIRDGIDGLTIPPVPTPTVDRRRRAEEIAIPVISDLQLGKVTSSYSSDICAQRIDKMADKVVSITEVQRSDHPVKTAAVFLLGDMLEGEVIFPGQAWEVDSSLYRQLTIDGPEIVVGFLRRMAATFQRVDVYAVPGNHGRLARKGDYNPESNADRMLYRICERATRGEKRIVWNIPDKDYHLVANLGDRLRFFLRHGHQVRGWAGIPWYGWVMRVLGDASLARIWPEYDYDYQVAGHFHTPVSMYVNGRRLWINASTESHNEYAAEKLRAAGEPAQWLLFGRPGFGVSAEYLVSLL